MSTGRYRWVLKRFSDKAHPEAGVCLGQVAFCAARVRTESRELKGGTRGSVLRQWQRKGKRVSMDPDDADRLGIGVASGQNVELDVSPADEGRTLARVIRGDNVWLGRYRRSAREHICEDNAQDAPLATACTSSMTSGASPVSGRASPGLRRVRPPPGRVPGGCAQPLSGGS